MSEAFAPNLQSNSGALRSGATKMEMGFFDGISKAFSNEEVSEASILIWFSSRSIYLDDILYEHKEYVCSLTFYNVMACN